MEEKKVNKAEEVKEEIKAEENGVELTDEQLEQVSGGIGAAIAGLGLAMTG